jgi:hypothetical protein
MRGKMLPNRLEIDVMNRLKRASRIRKISVNDVISLALDGLEGEREVAQTITDRIEFMEKNLDALVGLIGDLIEKSDRHFSEADINGKEHLRSLYILLESKLREYFAGGKP